MALEPTTLGQAISAAGAGILLGPTWPQTAQALGLGIYQWLITPGSVVLAGITTGTGLSPAPVPVSGKLTLAPNSPAIQAGLASVGVSGPTTLPLAAAIANGLSTAVSAAGQYAAITLTSFGVDVSGVVVANPATLIPLILQSMSAVYIGVGPSAVEVSTGLGNGIAAMVQGMTGTGSTTGVPLGPEPVSFPSGPPPSAPNVF